MAAVASVEGENSLQESEDSTGNDWAAVSKLCRKNGLSRACQYSESSSRSGICKTSIVHAFRTNGFGKIALNLKETIHSGRSRGLIDKQHTQSTACQNHRKTRRSSGRLDAEGIYRELHDGVSNGGSSGTTSSPSTCVTTLNNNKMGSSSTSSESSSSISNSSPSQKHQCDKNSSQSNTNGTVRELRSRSSRSRLSNDNCILTQNTSETPGPENLPWSSSVHASLSAKKPSPVINGCISKRSSPSRSGKISRSELNSLCIKIESDEQSSSHITNSVRPQRTPYIQQQAAAKVSNTSALINIHEGAIPAHPVRRSPRALAATRSSLAASSYSAPSSPSSIGTATTSTATTSTATAVSGIHIPLDAPDAVISGLDTTSHPNTIQVKSEDDPLGANLTQGSSNSVPGACSVRLCRTMPTVCTSLVVSASSTTTSSNSVPATKGTTGVSSTSVTNVTHSGRLFPGVTSSKPSVLLFPQRSISQDSDAQSSTSGQSSTESGGQCLWSKCVISLDPGESLMDHIRVNHVEPQQDKEHKVCLWDGCKVYNRTSSSQSWLQRHMLSHSGDKPFRCIVAGCGHRFASQFMLERHVNSHFNSNHVLGGKGLKSRDDTPSKNNKKKRFKRNKGPWPVKTEDFFDASAMEGLRYRLHRLHSATHMESGDCSHTVTFHSSVIAKRRDSAGNTQVLLRWSPEDMLPDAWLSEAEAAGKLTQVLPLSHLPRDAFAALEPCLYMSHRFRKHRRK